MLTSVHGGRAHSSPPARPHACFALARAHASIASTPCSLRPHTLQLVRVLLLVQALPSLQAPRHGQMLRASTYIGKKVRGSMGGVAAHALE